MKGSIKGKTGQLQIARASIHRVEADGVKVFMVKPDRTMLP
jgi:hypothetical protein